MKMIQLGLMILISVFCGCLSNHSTIRPANAAGNSPEATDNPMKLANSIKGLTIGKVEVSRTGNIWVELTEASKERVKVWKGSNSWGAACWRVLLIRNGNLETFFRNPDQGFTVNWPEFADIAG